MSNKKTITYALQGSASALGLNWIYDPSLLEEFCQNRSCIFLDIQHDLYNKAKKGFDVYTNHKAGDLDFLGEILYQLHSFLTTDQKHTPWEFFLKIHRFLETYDGYIESYGNDLLNRYSKDKLTSKYQTDKVDEQLINMGLYFAFHDKEQYSVDDALEYTKIFTHDPSSKTLIPMLKDFLDDLQELTLNEAINNVKMSLTKPYKERLIKAFECENRSQLLKEISTACGAKDAFAMILYILQNTSSTEEALEMNASLGGASAARGIFINVFASYAYGPINQEKVVLNKENI